MARGLIAPLGVWGRTTGRPRHGVAATPEPPVRLHNSPLEEGQDSGPRQDHPQGACRSLTSI